MSTDPIPVGGIPLPVSEPVDGQPERGSEQFCRLSAGLFELAGLEETNVTLAGQLRETAQRPLSQPSLFASPREAFCQSLHAYVSTLEYESTQVESREGCSPVVKSPGMSLLERMQEVMRVRKWSEREWARRAGLKEEANVNQIVRALKKDPDPEKVAGSADLFVKLARAANVSLDWLLGGRGSPYSFTVDVHDDPRYPSRARVIGVAHLLGFSEAAIRAVSEHAPDRDPGADYWLRILQAEQARVVPAPPDSPGEKVRK